MKYYKLIDTLDLKEIGKYPQSITPFSLGDIRDLSYKKPINISSLPEPAIHPKAKATTCLDVVYINRNIFLVIKDYFLDFLGDFNIPEYQSWSIKVHHKKEILTNYSLFRISYPSDEELVDYAKSEFLIGKAEDWKDPSIRKPVKVENFDNYNSLIDVLRMSEDESQIRCNKLVLDVSKNKKDMFRLINNTVLMGYIVSERLKNAIEEKKYTGMAFKELTEVDKRIEVIY